MKRTAFIALASVMAIMMSGCWFNPAPVQEGPATNDGILIMNGGASTISLIDIEEDTVYNDIAATGVYSNQILLKNGKLYCVNSGSSNITVYSSSTWASESPISLPLLSNPMEMAMVNDSIAVVTSLLRDEIYKINLNTKTIIDTAAAGDNPTPVLVSNGKIYVGNTAYQPLTYSYGQGSVYVYDAETLDSLKSINVGINPQKLAEDAQGNVHVLCTGNYFNEFGTVSVINTLTDEIEKSVAVGGSPGSMAIDLLSGVAYASSWGAGVISYDTETGTVLNDSSFTKGGVDVIVDDESIVWVASWGNDIVYKYDEDGVLLDSMIVGDGPQRMLRLKR